MKLAIMQPYFFPYIGYFQLANAVDRFVFYDDVNFIKNGWINRNKILINGQASYFGIQLQKASSNKLINEISFTDNRKKILKSVEISYGRAPFFQDVFELVSNSLSVETDRVSVIAMNTVKSVANYLNIDTQFELSSERYCETKYLKKEDRLIEICKSNSATTYINPIGGEELYRKSFFNKHNVKLFFIKTNQTPYKQFNHDFTAGLSILDVLMFNSIEEVNRMLNNYELL
jgi:hypothetical protein